MNVRTSRMQSTSYSAAHLIQNPCTAWPGPHRSAAPSDGGRREVDPTTPWMLLRGALENFATGLWFLDGAGRSERRRRALSLWDEDMRNRQQHETDTAPPGGAASGFAHGRCWPQPAP
ncbi:hypothetical protein [Streptomyces collinus]|uniref:hypothetical protein n=1 Tax=Streptomyces collinus TaxID=42684 RepID=UPI00294366BF|nr:hypothetical protein [Streptomyces collinus]